MRALGRDDIQLHPDIICTFDLPGQAETATSTIRGRPMPFTAQKRGQRNADPLCLEPVYGVKLPAALQAC
jgi:hypothetical protein